MVESIQFVKHAGRVPDRLALHIPDDERAMSSHVGGMRYSRSITSNATWPLVRLDIFDSGIRLRPSISFLRISMPTWEATFDELEEVRAVGRSMPTLGIRFRASTPDDWAVFWTFKQDVVLGSLRAAGADVAPGIEQFHYFNPSR